MLDGSLFALKYLPPNEESVPRAAKEIKRDPSLPPLQKVGPPVPESHKNWGPCFTSPKNAVVLLFLDLFRLLWR